MNVQFRMFRFPHKKAKLGIALNLLKVAQSLIKVGRALVGVGVYAGANLSAVNTGVVSRS